MDIFINIDKFYQIEIFIELNQRFQSVTDLLLYNQSFMTDNQSFSTGNEALLTD